LQGPSVPAARKLDGKPRAIWTGSLRELVAEGAIGDRNAVVDGGCRRPKWSAGLKAHVIQECRLGKIFFHDVAGV